MKVALHNCIFSNDIIYRNWLLVGTVRSVELLISDSRTIVDIQENAYARETFGQLETLEIVNMRISYLKRNIFNGLISLRTLHIARMHLTAIDAGILQTLSQLTSLLFEGAGDVPLDIRNLTGTTAMMSIQIVSLRENNFHNQIGCDSFSGLINAKSLFLTNSNLQSIGANAFTPMRDSVQLIDLRGNFLKSLPSNLFHGIVQRSDVSLHLNQNPWHCVCAPEIEDLQRNLWRYPNAFKDLSELKCGEPIEMAGKQLSAWDLCSQTDISIGVDHIKLSCHQTDPISIRKRLYSFSVRYSKKSNQLIIEMDEVNSDLMLLIMRNQLIETNVAITMSEAATVTCWRNLKLTMELRITSTHDHYLFCVLNRRRLPYASPLDCLSHHIRHRKRPPNTTNDLICVIAIVGLLTFLSIIFLGSLIGLTIWPKKTQNLKNKSRSIHRSISEASDGSAKTDASARIPFPFAQISWHMIHTRKSTPPNPNDLYDCPVARDTAIGHDQISAPPLPERPSHESHSQSIELARETNYNATKTTENLLYLTFI